MTRKRPKAKNQGFYQPVHPEKYIGNPDEIVFRSNWERIVMIYLDNNANVLKWGSEEFHIPYVSPIDEKVHRYFPDFIATIKDSKGKNRIVVMEVKPLKDMRPSNAKRNSKRFLTEMKTFAVNDAKFVAMRKFCSEKGWEFMTVTENEIESMRRANGT